MSAVNYWIILPYWFVNMVKNLILKKPPWVFCWSEKTALFPKDCHALLSTRSKGWLGNAEILDTLAILEGSRIEASGNRSPSSQWCGRLCPGWRGAELLEKRVGKQWGSADERTERDLVATMSTELWEEEISLEIFGEVFQRWIFLRKSTGKFLPFFKVYYTECVFFECDPKTGLPGICFWVSFGMVPHL